MKRETLDKARELEHQIETYNKIAFAMTFPWQKYRLWNKRIYLSGGNYGTEINLNDRELAKLIEDYCRAKVKKLTQEMEEL